MLDCLICDVGLNRTNRTEEHIFLNAIGGRLSSWELVCKGCNDTLGSSCDAKLAKAFNHCSSLLNIERDEGEPQPMQVMQGDQAYVMNPGGSFTLAKPFVNIERSQEKATIQIKARSMDEARKILEGVKKRFPKLDVEKEFANASNEKKYLSGFVTFAGGFDGDEVFPGIAKIAYFFLKLRHPDLKFKDNSIVKFLRNETSCDKLFWFYPEKSVVENHQKILHSVIIKSYPAEGLLVGFVELFSLGSFAVLFSDDFHEDIQETYVFDVLTRNTVKNPVLNIPSMTKGYLNDWLDRKIDFIDKLTERYKMFLPIALNKQLLDACNTGFSNAYKLTLQKYDAGATVTKEMLNEFIDAYMTEITPLIANQLASAEPPQFAR